MGENLSIAGASTPVDLPALEGALNRPTIVPPPPLNFAPLVERAPELTQKAIADVYEAAARQLELAGDAVMQRAIDCVATVKEAAQAMRDRGAKEAAAVESAATMARDAVRLSKDLQQRARGVIDAGQKAANE